MYEIKEAKYGFELTFAGSIDVKEMTQWLADSNIALRKMVGKKFQVLIHMDELELKPLQEAAKKILIDGQAIYKRIGMTRSAVIVPNLLVKMQMENTAKASGIHEYERYFTKDKIGNAMNWIREGKE